MSWVYLTSTTAATAWMLSFIVRSVSRLLGRSAPPAANWFFFEVRPLAPFFMVGAFLAGAVAYGSDGTGIRIFNLVMGLANWLMARREKDDDDRWKRRRDAATARVAEIGGRLQVVPAKGGS